MCYPPGDGRAPGAAGARAPLVLTLRFGTPSSSMPRAFADPIQGTRRRGAKACLPAMRPGGRLVKAAVLLLLAGRAHAHPRATVVLNECDAFTPPLFATSGQCMRSESASYSFYCSGGKAFYAEYDNPRGCWGSRRLRRAAGCPNRVGYEAVCTSVDATGYVEVELEGCGRSTARRKRSDQHCKPKQEPSDSPFTTNFVATGMRCDGERFYAVAYASPGCSDKGTVVGVDVSYPDLNTRNASLYESCGFFERDQRATLRCRPGRLHRKQSPKELAVLEDTIDS